MPSLPPRSRNPKEQSIEKKFKYSRPQNAKAEKRPPQKLPNFISRYHPLNPEYSTPSESPSKTIALYMPRNACRAILPSAAPTEETDPSLEPQNYEPWRERLRLGRKNIKEKCRVECSSRAAVQLWEIVEAMCDARRRPRAFCPSNCD